LELRDRLDERRRALGLTQRAVADALGVTQPHYSKMVGGIVPITDHRAAEMELWLRATSAAPVPPGPRSARMERLARSIERQVAELARLLASEGIGSGRSARSRPASKVRR